MMCLPSASNTAWTYDYSNQACRPVFSLRVYSYEIVGAELAGTVVLTVNASTNALVSSDPNYRVNYTYVFFSSPQTS